MQINYNNLNIDYNKIIDIKHDELYIDTIENIRYKLITIQTGKVFKNVLDILIDIVLSGEILAIILFSEILYSKKYINVNKCYAKFYLEKINMNENYIEFFSDNYIRSICISLCKNGVDIIELSQILNLPIVSFSKFLKGQDIDFNKKQFYKLYNLWMSPYYFNI